jgi:hypothetical protein
MPIQAYRKAEELTTMAEWLMIGEVSPPYKPFHIIKWSDLVLDLDQKYPNYYSVRHPEMGIRQHNDDEVSERKKNEINSH